MPPSMKMATAFPSRKNLRAVLVGDVSRVPLLTGMHSAARINHPAIGQLMYSAATMNDSDRKRTMLHMNSGSAEQT